MTDVKCLMCNEPYGEAIPGLNYASIKAACGCEGFGDACSRLPKSTLNTYVRNPSGACGLHPNENYCFKCSQKFKYQCIMCNKPYGRCDLEMPTRITAKCGHSGVGTDCSNEGMTTHHVAGTPCKITWLNNDCYYCRQAQTTVKPVMDILTKVADTQAQKEKQRRLLSQIVTELDAATVLNAI